MSLGEQLLESRSMFHLAASIDRLLLKVAGAIYTRRGQMAIDAAIAAVGFWLSYQTRFDGAVPTAEREQFALVVPFVVALYAAGNLIWSPYNRVWRFFSLPDAADLLVSVSCAGAITLLWRFLAPFHLTRGAIPTGVLLMHPVFTYAGWCGVRLSRRLLYQKGHVVSPQAPRSGALTAKRKRVVLVGAGEAGLYLLREIRTSEFEVIGFIDDEPALQGRTIGGIRVLGTIAELEAIVSQYRIAEVILSLPSASRATIQKIARRCAKVPVKISSVPDSWEIMAGKARIDNLRPVSMEELLGRAKVTHAPHLEEVFRVYSGRRILVTGAGGSIGSELVRQLKHYGPSELILLDKDENNLYETSCEVREDFSRVKEVVANVRDREVLARIFARFSPEIVFHAAAYKHVPLMEHYPAEAILNNVLGTRNVAELSDQCSVKSFLMISTDKAVNPTSIMGASKRVAELIVGALAAAGSQTRFSCVRFGNVLGSRASVVPLFQRQIRQRQTITITHPEVSRYFMTIPEAVQLIIRAGTFGAHGEIMMLDMGDPVKIVDLAKNLIELSGLEPERDVKIEFTGLRPGEKLNEELLGAGERGVRDPRYRKILVVEALGRSWTDLEGLVRALTEAAGAHDADRIRECLRAMEIGYHHAEANAVIAGMDSSPDVNSGRRSMRRR
jgi:FlaA1/EpsC-like NDP-sugar epimerase